MWQPHLNCMIAHFVKVDGIIYNTAIQNLGNKVCGSICTVTKYQHKLSLLSKNVLSKELKTYGDGYFIIWQFYSSLYVNEKVENVETRPNWLIVTNLKDTQEETRVKSLKNTLAGMLFRDLIQYLGSDG